MARRLSPDPPGEHSGVQRSRMLAVGVGAIIALAGCGSSSTTSHSTSASTSASPQSGEAAKPPAQIVSDAAAALRAARSYVMQGQLTQNGRTAHLSVTASGSNALEMTIASGPSTVELIVLPSGSYIRANAAFWSAHGGGRAAVLADRWVEVPPANAQAMTAGLGQFAPATLSRCLVEGHGTLSVAGRTTVAGRPAIVIKDAGNVPGGAAGTLAVAATGSPYPLQARNAGPHHPGGRIDACNDGKAENVRGTLNLSHFGSAPGISPPAHPVVLGGQTGST